MTVRTARRQTTGSVLGRGARALAVGVALAAVNLVGMTGVAQARPVDGPDEMVAQGPPTQVPAGEYRRNRPVTPTQQASADAALRRQLARERFSVPDQTPAPVPSVSTSPSGWLVASLVALAAVLVLSIGPVLRVARRANRRVRAGPAA